MLIVTGNAIINPVVQLMADVISKEDSCRVLQTDLRRMENLLQDVVALFRDQPKAPPGIVMTRLRLLKESLEKAKRLLDRSEPCQSCRDCVVCNPSRYSKEIGEWNASFDELYHIFQGELSILVTSLQFVSSKPLYKKKASLQGVAASGFLGSGIVDAQAQVERWLNEGDRVHLIGVYGMPGVGKTSLLKMVHDKYKEVSKGFKVIWVRIPEDYMIFDLQGAIGDQIGRKLPIEFVERKKSLSGYLKTMKFLMVLDDLWSRFDLRELGVEFGEDKHSKVLFSTRREDLIREIGAEESIEIQPLSRDEGWKLFRTVAFKDDHFSVDIPERARRFADQCKGVPLAINIVAAMIGQINVDEWDTCFSLMKDVSPSFPATHPRLDAELYKLLRWSYDALPNSNVKKCFLYCAMYKEDQEIDSRQLLQMWIGEGLVKSKQGTHWMDMAIAQNYLKVLVDRCLFLIVNESSNVFRKYNRNVHDVIPVRVHHGIRDMAMYIAEKEENSLFMASQNLRNFLKDYNENCSRISFPDSYIGDLPTDLRCPKLASLILEGKRDLKELPSELRLTSLRVLNLSGCTGITSVPTSVGQLRLLEFLSLSRLPIEDLCEGICHLSGLQFLDLSWCTGLKSLPSQIGELKNLKHLNLDGCNLLKMIPLEISELTSLSRLQLKDTDLSVEMEAPASIWSLKGLKNLMELRVSINTSQDGKGLRIKDGIMGTWTEMRHLALYYPYNSPDEIKEDLPQGMQNISYEIREVLPRDMKNMKKLRSFRLWNYEGPSLPNCRFEDLEIVKLSSCSNIRELSPLERLPNLKLLKLMGCDNLRELGIGSPERVPGGYLRLEKLVLKRLPMLETLGGLSDTEVWNERTLPHLRVLKICDCDSLKRFPLGIEKLQNLRALEGCPGLWWQRIMWNDDNMKFKLRKIFIPCDGPRPAMQGRESTRAIQGKESSPRPAIQGRESTRAIQGREGSPRPAIQGRESSPRPAIQGRESSWLRLTLIWFIIVAEVVWLSVVAVGKERAVVAAVVWSVIVAVAVWLSVNRYCRWLRPTQ